MKKLLTLGETMACFLPGAPGPLRYVSGYRLAIAGAESNLAIDAAKLGVEAVWFSRLGQDEFGAFVRNQVRAEGVDCRAVVFDETHPTGLMFKQTGVGESRVYYYRAGSAASFLSPDDITPALFAGVGLLHLTGITPVLSEDVYKRQGLGHAGLAETAIYLHLCPEAVQLDRLPPKPEKLYNTQFGIVDSATFDTGPNEDYSVRYDPRDASPELGRQIVDYTVARCVRLVNEARASLSCEKPAPQALCDRNAEDR